MASRPPGRIQSILSSPGPVTIIISGQSNEHDHWAALRLAHILQLYHRLDKRNSYLIPGDFILDSYDVSARPHFPLACIILPGWDSPKKTPLCSFESELYKNLPPCAILALFVSFPFSPLLFPAANSSASPGSSLVLRKCRTLQNKLPLLCAST